MALSTFLLLLLLLLLTCSHRDVTVPRTVNGTGHTGPKLFCAACQNVVLRRSPFPPL